MKFLVVLSFIALAKGADFSGRIFNGHNAFATDAFVFRVLSIENEETIWANVSSGVAVSENFGLVVAQAVYGFQTWYIGYGSIHVNQHLLQEIDPNSIMLHPFYSPQTLTNNIGVLRFSSPVAHFIPIALARPDFPVLMTFGYGFTDRESSTITNTLQQLVVMDTTHEPCASNYPEYNHAASLCGLFPILTEYADGDQGGAVVDVNRERLYGLVSHWGGGSNDPLVSVSVAAHSDFIDHAITTL